MSLLDLLNSKDPAVAQGLLQAGLSLLQSKGSLAPAIGRAGQAGTIGAQAYRNQTLWQQQEALQNKLRQGQLEEQQRLAQMRALPQKFSHDPNAGVGGFDMQGYLDALKGYDPMQAYQAEAAMQPKRLPPIISKPGDVARDPTTGAELWANPAEPKEASLDPLSKLIAARDALPLGHPNRKIFDDKIRKESSHAPAASTTISYGSLTPVQLPDGSMGFAQASNRGGAQVVPGMRPPPMPTAADKPMAEGAQKQVVGTRNLKDAVDNYVTALDGWDNAKMLMPDQRARMGNAYNNMMLQAKEAYNLGVLNGPDYQILQSVVQDPTAPMSALTSNKALKRQALELKKIASGIEKRVLEAHGKSTENATPARRAEDKDPLGIR